MPVDFLVFGPHPDDAEIGAGGLLLKMKQRGHRTGIVDMTTGDMGWGTPEIRAGESEQAARILGLDVRENLDLGDCRVEDTFENRCRAAALIRKHRPEVVIAPWYDLPIGRGLGHNDHYKTGEIVANAYNLAHLAKAPIAGEPHQARAIWHYFIPPGTKATFVVDISDVFEQWLDAIDRHQSQFYHPERPRPAHLPQPREAFEAHARFWGWQIGARYGQAFLSAVPLRVDDPLELVRGITPRP